MFIRKATYRRFEYMPRYYNPTTDPEERRKRRVRFHSNVRRGRNRSMLWLIAMLALALTLYLFIAG